MQILVPRPIAPNRKQPKAQNRFFSCSQKNISIALARSTAKFCVCFENRPKKTLNSEYCKRALEKVKSPNTLINMVSKRVRQLTSGGGAGSRPLLADTVGLGAGDIALLEIAEGKMAWIVDENAKDLPPPGPETKFAF